MANIYLHIEIKKREFEAKFFTGLKAALRGHRVLVGYLLPLLRNDLLAPGIFHDKALTPRPKKIASMKAARAAGHHYTSIDEEHGLLRESYELFANLRYSAETIEQASAVMFWGPHDFNYMKKAYPQFAHKFHMTGNPRADLWRAEFAPVFDVELPVKKPYVLFVSNLGSVFSEGSLGDTISALRNGYFEGPSDPKEFQFYREYAHGALMGAEYILAIRRIASEFSGLTVVVRAHPVERPSVWRALIGNYPNIVVNSEGTINSWLRNATAIVQNGCTTAFEAVKCGTPVLTYAPVDDFAEDYYFPNRLGKKVKNTDQLMTALRSLVEEGPSERINQDFSVLSERLLDTGSETSADLQISIWERLAAESGLSTGGNWRGHKVPVLKSLESYFDIYRFAKYVPQKFMADRRLPSYPRKFEVLNGAELDQLKERFARYNPEFRNLRVKRIGPRICEISA